MSVFVGLAHCTKTEALAVFGEVAQFRVAGSDEYAGIAGYRVPDHFNSSIGDEDFRNLGRWLNLPAMFGATASFPERPASAQATQPAEHVVQGARA